MFSLSKGSQCLVIGLVFSGVGCASNPSGGTGSGTGNAGTGAGGSGVASGSGTGSVSATGNTAGTGTQGGSGSGTVTGTGSTGGTGSSAGTGGVSGSSSGGSGTVTGTGSASGAASGAGSGAASGVAMSGASGGSGAGSGSTTAAACGPTGAGPLTADGVNCPAGVHGDCTGATMPIPTHAGYTLYLDEEFTNPMDLDCDPNFTWSDGGLTESSVRFVKSQISFANGNMILTADNRPANAMIPTYTYAENVGVPPNAPQFQGKFMVQPQVSGEMRTKYNNYRYGWYEVRYKPPTSTGNFISTFFVFRTPRLQDWQEIDVELTPAGNGSPGPGGVGTNVYYNLMNAGAGYNGGKADANEMVALPNGITNNQADFHVYAFEWQPTFVKWYVDGTLVRSKLAAGGGVAPGSNPGVPIPKESVKIFMNLWIFGQANAFGGNNPGANTYPMSATYDYVRFYKLNDATIEPTYPCSPVPGCLINETYNTAMPHRDITASKNNPEDGVPFLYP